ncbi:MAG: putative phage tail protein [Bacillota bacterium]|jgi:hypothetical protein
MKNYLEYLPDFYGEILDFHAIGEVLDEVYDSSLDAIEEVQQEFYLNSSSEERLSYWERRFGIAPEGRTTEQRRRQIAGRMQGGGKLNETKIKDVVYTFTGGQAIVTFADSTITVSVAPPDLGENYRFSDVAASLRPLIPAHLALSVIRFYNTWLDRAENHSTWQAVGTDFESWLAVRNRVEEV